MHACTCVVLRTRSPRAPQVSVPCPEVVYLSDEAANHGYWRLLQNHCSCSHILLWYCSSFDSLWYPALPQGLDCILPSRGLNLQLYFEAETVAWNSLISVSRANTRTWSCQMLRQNKNLLGTDRKAVNKTDLRFHVVVEKHSIRANWPGAMSLYSRKQCWKGQTMVDQKYTF